MKLRCCWLVLGGKIVSIYGFVFTFLSLFRFTFLLYMFDDSCKHTKIQLLTVKC